MRKVIELTGRLCQKEAITDWRQYRFNLKQLKKQYRKAQKIKYPTSKNEEKKAARCEEVHQAYQDYLLSAEELMKKSQQALKALVSLNNLLAVEQIHHYIQHAERQTNQIDRRVLKGKVIPHKEKVFSIFEEHTEWVSKGKAGVPVELGVRVCVLEDQHQFILHHRHVPRDR